MSSLTVESINNLRHEARCVVRELGLLNDAFFDIGVTLAERHLLIELAEDTGPTMKEIGEKLLIEKSTVSRLIARAEKKGYISLSFDNDDRRKRHIYLTPLGKKTLKAFEKVAFSQTHDALLTLGPHERALVEQGVSLYAKGLKTVRVEGKKMTSPKEPLHIPLNQDFALVHYSDEDREDLYSVFQEVAGTDSYFPNESSSFQEFETLFFGPTSEVFVCKSCKTREVVGGFYIKSNCPGRGSHVANAAYMIKKAFRGKGIGTALIEASLQLALKQGYKAMQFNMVLSSNQAAVALYKKLGFSIVGTIPEAIRNGDNTYQDGYIFYKKLGE